MLAAAAGDGTVWLWTSRAVPAVGAGDAHRLGRALYFDVADSRRPLLVTTGVGREVRLWDMDPERVAAQICAVAGTPVTEAEWRRHLPSKPYDPPC